MDMKAKIGCGIVIAALGVGVITIGTSVKTVQPGYAGIVYNMNGGLENTSVNQGVHFIPPWKQLTQYPISTESVYFSKEGSEGRTTDESISPITSDSKTVSMDTAYTYHFDNTKLASIFNKFRGQSADTISDGYIRQFMKDSINTITSQYSIFDICGSKQAEIVKKIYEDFSTKMQKDGIVIESFSITAVRPDAETAKSIQAKVNADQQMQTSKVKLEQTKIEAEQKVTKAKAEAEANKIVENSINDTLIQYNKWNKWDGKLPSTMAGNNADVLVNGK